MTILFPRVGELWLKTRWLNTDPDLLLVLEASGTSPYCVALTLGTGLVQQVYLSLDDQDDDRFDYLLWFNP